MFANNFNNQNPYMFGGMFPQGQQYTPNRKPRFTNPLTEEDKKSLKTQGGFNLLVDEKDMKKAICTHKDGDQISLKPNEDGTFTCWICGETFNLLDMQKQSVEEVTNNFIDILQSIKTYYLDIPAGVVTEFFQMIPFIKKTPEIYQIALNNYHGYETPMTGPNYPNNNMFGMYDAMANPGYAYNPNYGYQQPMGFAPQYQPPMGYQPPQYPQGMPMGAAPTMPQNAQPVGQFGYVDNSAPVGSVPPQNAPVSPIPQPGSGASDTVQTTKTFAL